MIFFLADPDANISQCTGRMGTCFFQTGLVKLRFTVFGNGWSLRFRAGEHFSELAVLGCGGKVLTNRIAKKGQKRVYKDHTYKKRMSDILNVLTE